MNGGRNDGFEKTDDARAQLRLADRKEEMGDGKSTRTEAVETDGLRRWPDGWILPGFAGPPTAVALVPSSCGGQEGSVGPAKETPSPGEEAESAGRAAGVSVADVTDDHDEFYGKKVTLGGLVTGKVGPDSIAIGGEAFGGEPVLIMGAARKLERMAQGLPDSEVAAIRRRYLAQVTGTPRGFDVQEVEEEVGSR